MTRYLLCLVILLPGCSGSLQAQEPPAKSESEQFAESTDWSAIAKKIGGTGTLKPLAYTVSVPRTDLSLGYDDGEVPVDAGLESQFHFFRCPCGKMNLIGEFLVIDYEVNDVVDELRLGRMRVASISPMLLMDKPRMMIIRFQGQGETSALASVIKSALNRTGEARSSTRPVD